MKDLAGQNLSFVKHQRRDNLEGFFLLNREFLSLMVVGGDLFPARSLSIGTTIDVSILLHWMHAKEARAGYNGGERGLGHIVLKFACLPLSKLS